MSISEELQKLQALHASGAISEEEYKQAKAAVLNGAPAALPATAGPAAPSETSWLRSLTRSNDDAWLGGVCGGLGEHTSLPSWCWRLMYLVGVLFAGIGLIPYIIMWICVPPDPRGE
jgi:phage shock protein C